MMTSLSHGLGSLLPCISYMLHICQRSLANHLSLSLSRPSPFGRFLFTPYTNCGGTFRRCCLDVEEQALAMLLESQSVPRSGRSRNNRARSNLFVDEKKLDLVVSMYCFPIYSEEERLSYADHPWAIVGQQIVLYPQCMMMTSSIDLLTMAKR